MSGATAAQGFVSAPVIADKPVVPSAEEGRVAERSAALQRSMELIKQRGETNEAMGRVTDGNLCHKLGGKWLRDTGTWE
ncbi:hypothetical protein [Rhizobium tibeticum]|nr:hypothetical protein [Rhizobium tibeticum]